MLRHRRPTLVVYASITHHLKILDRVRLGGIWVAGAPNVLIVLIDDVGFGLARDEFNCAEKTIISVTGRRAQSRSVDLRQRGLVDYKRADLGRTARSVRSAPAAASLLTLAFCLLLWQH